MSAEALLPIPVPAEALIRILQAAVDLDRGTTPFPGVTEAFLRGDRYECGLSVQGDTLWLRRYADFKQHERLSQRMRTLSEAVSREDQVADAQVDATDPKAADMRKAKAEARRRAAELRRHLAAAQKEVEGWTATTYHEFPVSTLKDQLWNLLGVSHLQVPAAETISVVPPNDVRVRKPRQRRAKGSGDANVPKPKRAKGRREPASGAGAVAPSPPAG